MTNLKSEFDERFRDIKSLNYDFMLFENPYSVSIGLIQLELQIELAELQFHSVLSNPMKKNTLIDYYASLDQIAYSRLHLFSLRIASIFGSIYLCEQLFSMLKYNKNCYRNRLSDANLKSQLKLISSSFKPNFSHLSKQL